MLFRSSDLLADFERLTRGLNLGPDFDQAVDDLSTTITRAFGPGVDAVRSAERFELFIDLPGVAPDAVELTVDGRDLTISTNREFSVPESSEHVHAGRRHGAFSRTFRLADDLDIEAVSAHFEHGVLTVSIPVVEAAKPRRIEITSAE